MTREALNRSARSPTMADVAARVGMSKALVSLVFRGAPGASAETRARVLQVADELGYRSNRTASLLARKRTRLIGVPVLLRDAYRSELAEEIQVAADEHQYSVALSPVTRAQDERAALENLLELRCEGLVLLSPELPAGELTALGKQLPVVVVGRRVRARTLDVVRTADAAGVSAAVDHLVALGHRDVLHVDGGRAAMAADRRRGYADAMARHRLHAQVLPGGYDEQAGARAAHRLLDAGRLPTAVLTANDRSALGLLDVLVRASVRVPDDLSVVGFDDSVLAGLDHISLTTVAQEARLQAVQAVSALLERLDGARTTARNIVVPARLVVRGTTGPARTTVAGQPGEPASA